MHIAYSTYQNPIKEITEDKRKDIWKLGTDNRLPHLVEDLITQSPTASTALSLASKAVIGGGLDSTLQVSDELNVNELYSIAANEFIKHGNLYFEVSYNGELKVNNIKVIPQPKIRRGKSDDLGFSGHYHFDNYEFTNNKKEAQLKHTYSPKVNVIKAQIESVGNILDWNGQIMHVKSDYASNYSLPMCYSVLQDMLAEQNSSLYRANNITKGFADNNIISTPRLADDEANTAFVNQFKAMQGAIGAGQDLLIQPATGTEDLDKVLKILPLSKTAKSDKFQYADEKAEQNIAKAFRIPQILINPSDSGLFGNSGELLNSARAFLYETYKDERNLILGKLNQLLSNWHEGAITVNVINPFETKEAVNEYYTNNSSRVRRIRKPTIR